MMTQRNVELQLQALDLIEKNQLAQSTADEGDDRSADASSDPGWVYGGSPSINLSYAIAGEVLYGFAQCQNVLDIFIRLILF